MTEFEPPLRLQLDGDALVANWRYLKAQGKAACGAAVKADGYGLGAREVVTRLRDTGCRDFFVAQWNESAAIADLVPPEWIAVLNGIDAVEIPLIRQIGVIPVLNTPKQIALWKASGGGACHVMLDSGINRLGIGTEQMDIALFDGLDIDILMSHLASADEDIGQNSEQLERFNGMAAGIAAKRRSLSNSAGIMLGSGYHFDLTRPGLSLYGGIARPEMAAMIKPVVRMSAKVLQIRKLKSGDPVGYNATFKCPTDMRVATLAIGYADGYPRALSGIGAAVHNGKKLSLIGRVSMDLVTVDVSSAPDIQEGDWLPIEWDMAAAATATGRSQYELLTGLGKRFQKNWFG